MGMTGQMLLVGTAMVVPLFFPAALPKPARLITWLQEPGPPPGPRPNTVANAIARTVLRPPVPTDGRIYEPVNPPAHATPIIDEPPAATAAGPDGVIGGTGLGGTGRGGRLIDTIMATASAPFIPPVVRRAAPPAAAEPAPVAIPRLRAGGLVKLAVPIRRVEPVYPDMARKLRVSGVVKLEGVITTDGRIAELRVISGNPLLTKAALDAVRQWLYSPTLLNGDPVEVIAPIEVVFRLN
jgi:protein TonB